MDEHRLKAIMIKPEYIINLFSKPQLLEEDGYMCINVPYIPGLPNDYKVINVSYDPMYAGMLLLIHSMSFDVIPYGAIIPIMEFETNVVVKKRRYKKDEPYQPLL